MKVFGDKIEIIDLSPKGNYRSLHPTYIKPDSIPIPGESTQKATSVTGLYEGLKVFEKQNNVSLAAIFSKTMNGLYRPANSSTGKLTGFKYGYL